MANNFCQLHLTCANQAEADKIARALLTKRLIACAKQLPISSAYWWQGKIEEANEIMLIMDSKSELFAQVEAEVIKLHSYDTFVLQQVATTNVSKKAAAWLHKELA